MDARVFAGTMERTPCESLQERIGRRNAINLSCSRSDALPSSPVNGRGRQVALVRGERHGAKVRTYKMVVSSPTLKALPEAQPTRIATGVPAAGSV
jgi:hypothetical protein